ncbi:hypothetical protein QE152_g12630 [Popillia japonica]|uniref:Uncharacterized protein n=1 Tax=Popillia japonica TaxID=7064 RepID=A0AAW1LRB9_POPJA
MISENETIESTRKKEHIICASETSNRSKGDTDDKGNFTVENLVVDDKSSSLGEGQHCQEDIFLTKVRVLGSRSENGIERNDPERSTSKNKNNDIIDVIIATLDQNNPQNISSDKDEILEYYDIDPNYKLSESSRSDKENNFSEHDSNSETNATNLETVNDQAHEETVKSRTRNYKKWKSTIRKEKRAGGEQYITKNKKAIKCRTLGIQDSCRLKCSQQFLKKIAKIFYSSFGLLKLTLIKNGNLSHHPSVLNLLSKDVKEQERGMPKDIKLCVIFLSKGNTSTAVCKKFYLNTLDISQTFVRTALAKRGSGGVELDDKRRKNIHLTK